MYEPIDGIIEKLRWLVFGIFVILVPIIVFSILLPSTNSNANAAIQLRSGTQTAHAESPNVVTVGMSENFSDLTDSLSKIDKSINNGVRSVTGGIAGGAKTIGSGIYIGGTFVGRSIYSGTILIGRGIASSVMFVGRTVGSAVLFTVSLPVKLVGAATETSVVKSIIQPKNSSQVPVIDPDVPIKVASQEQIHSAGDHPETASEQFQPVQSIDNSSSWPIRGRITTLFGVPHWPYQPTHTGMDISDGQPSGITPIYPFKPGRVVKTIYSRSGLGNHVVVDHGNGISSLYGHLASINVNAGQEVDKNSVLGKEGTTGVSTGTHLHFEIWVDGKPVDPRKFISGQPN